MISQSKKNTFYAYLTFWVWPFFGLMYAIRNVRASYVKNIVWLFVAFFGYTFNISNDDADVNRYKQSLNRLYKQNDQPYMDLLVEPYKNKGIYSGTDIYAHIVTLTFSRFTNDFRLFYGFIGFVFGYFYSRCLFYLLDYVQNQKLKWLTVLLLMTLGLVIPFWNINGYRYFTAAMIFLLASLKIIFERKYRFIFLALTSVLVHFSFVFAFAILLIYLLLGNRVWLYAGFLFISMFFANINPQTINENASIAPKFMKNKVTAYTNEEYTLKVQENEIGNNWYVNGSGYALQFVIYALIIWILIHRRRYFCSGLEKPLMSFGMLLLASANVVSKVPSMGRFYVLANFILVTAFILIIQQYWQPRLVNRMGALVILPLSLFIIVSIRIGFDFIGLNTLFLNPMIAWAFPDSPALIEFIK